jgi:hypothetical protein
MTPKEKAKELVDKMGIERVSIVTSVTPRPETTYYGWMNGKYAKQCALIAVDEILTNGYEVPYWQQVKTEIEAL